MVVAKAILTLLGIVALIASALIARECTPTILPGICGDPDFHAMVPILALTLIFAFLDFARR